MVPPRGGVGQSPEEEMMATIKEWQKRAYEQSAASGFHEDDARTSLREMFAVYLMNKVSESAELWEAFREGKVRRQCCLNMIGGCLAHNDRDIDRRTGMCSVGAAERPHMLCNKAEKMRALGLPELTCLEEELADIVIRCLDTAETFGVDLERAIEAKHAYNGSRPRKHGGKLA